MGMDIRLPIGLMFTTLGLVLALFGLFGDKSIYRSSLGINVNLIWGLVLIVFGAFMLWMARRGSAAMRPAETTPEGRAIEAMEHRTGKESDGRPQH